MRKSVVSAIAGTNLKKLKIGSIMNLTALKFPTRSPNGTPSTTASSQPLSTLEILAIISIHNVPFNMSSFTPAIVSTGLGRKYSSYLNEPSPHIAIKITHEITPHFNIFCFTVHRSLLIFNGKYFIKYNISDCHQMPCS